MTRSIIEPAIGASAVSAFQAQYRLAALRRQTDPILADLDFVLTPTTGTIYRIDAVQADPIRLNGNLGLYTNFMNLLDCAAVAVPAGFGSNGLPYGVTLFGPAFTDGALAVYGDRLHRALDLPRGATGRTGGTPCAVDEPRPAEPRSSSSPWTTLSTWALRAGSVSWRPCSALSEPSSCATSS